MPEIGRDQLKAMLSEAPAEQREPLLLRLKERGYTVAPEEHGFFSKDPGEVMRAAHETAWNLPVPGLAAAKAAMGSGGQALENVGGAISEKLGEHGVPDVLSAAIGSVPAIPGAIYKKASSLVPDKLGEVAIQAGTEGAVQGLGLAANTARPIAEELTPTFMEMGGKAAKGIKGLANVKIPLTPAEIAQSPQFAALEQALKDVPWSSGIMKRFQEIRNAAIMEHRNAVLEAIGPRMAKETLGDTTQEVLSKTLAASAEKRQAGLEAARSKILPGGRPSDAYKEGSKLIDTVSEAQSESRSKASELFKIARKDQPESLELFDPQELRAKAEELHKQHVEGINSLPSDVAEQIRRVKEGPQGLSWDKLHELQSTWGKRAQEAINSNGGQPDMNSYVYGQLRGAAHESMQRRAEDVGGDFLTKYKDAKDFFRDDYKGRFANDTVRRVLKSDPENAYNLFIRNGSVEDIRRLKGIVGEGGMKPMEKMLIEDVVGSSGSDIPSSDKIAKSLADMRYQLKEVLAPEKIVQLDKFAKTGELPKFVESELEKSLGSVAKKNPIALVDKIVGGRDVEMTSSIKKILGPQRFKPYQREFAERLLNDVDQPLVSGTKMSSQMRALDDAPKFRRQFVSDAGWNDIKKIQELKSTLETTDKLRGNTSGTAKNMIAWEGGKMLVTNPLKGTALAVSAPVLAKFYLSDVGRRILIDGMTQGERRNIANFARFSAFALNAGREVVDEERQKQGLAPAYGK